jgi:EamA domain-containing membrane protein RarD
VKPSEVSADRDSTGPLHSPFLHGVLAFVLWGCFPVYFKLVQTASPEEILSHRVIWSAAILLGILFFTRRLHILRLTLSDRRRRSGLVLTSLLIAANWLVFIWAVNHQHALEASLGYFICPLLNCLFGYLFYGERLGPCRSSPCCSRYWALPYHCFHSPVSPGYHCFWRRALPCMAPCARKSRPILSPACAWRR